MRYQHQHSLQAILLQQRRMCVEGQAHPLPSDKMPYHMQGPRTKQQTPRRSAGKRHLIWYAAEEWFVVHIIDSMHICMP